MLSFKILILSFLIIEAITIYFRFCLNMKSKDRYKQKVKKSGSGRVFHWHHFIIGIAIVLFSLFFEGQFEKSLFNLGTGVFVSDLVHHFVVLYFFTGKTEFYLQYKDKSEYRRYLYSDKKRDKLVRKVTCFV